MKNIIYSLASVFVFALLLTSCTEDEDYEVLTWKQTISLTPAMDVDANGFLVGVNAATGVPQKLMEDLVNIRFDLNWGDGENPISEVKLFIYGQEGVGEDIALHGKLFSKELATITTFDEEGGFDISLTSDDIYQMFRYDFDGNNDRSVTQVLPGDVFEIKWMITHKDGSVLDTRDACVGVDCQTGFAVKAEKLVIPYWPGTFTYKYLDAGTESHTVAGDEGEIVITKLTDEDFTYELSNAIFDGYDGFPWGAANALLTCDYQTGEFSIVDEYDVHWEIIGVQDKVLTISWTYKYSDGYDEWGIIELTRSDDLNWSSNVHSL